MNLPNFREILGKLSVFKNNLALLVPVILFLIGVLLLIPTQLMSSKLRAKVQEESIRKGAKRIDRLKSDPVPHEQYQMEATRQAACAKDAKEIERLAVVTTQRELLSYDIFPEPDPNADFSALIFQVFGERFRGGIEERIRRANALDCPTREELDRSLESSSASRSRSRGGGSQMRDTLGSISGGRGGGGYYQGSMGMGMGSINRLIMDEVCEARAKSISVYANPVDIAGYDFWAEYKYEGKEDAIKDCWYSQLAYWVTEDIFDTIAAMNAGHDNVLTAPVKRFLDLSFTMGLKRPRAGGGVFRGARGRGRGGAGQGKEDTDRPVYVLSDKDGLTESCTGRSSGEDADNHVIHFNVALVVSASDVLPVMDKLCSAKEHRFSGYPDGQQPPETYEHNQITVLESKIGFLNPNDMTHRYYSYGDDNVVELNLICEYLFNKKGYEAILPEPVKKTLAGEEEEKR